MNQNVQNVCNYIGDFAANVLPLAEDSDDAFLGITGVSNSVGAIVATVFSLIILFMLIWCQYPFLRDEMEKNPHVHTTDDDEQEAAEATKAAPAGGKSAAGIKIEGVVGGPLYTWAEWSRIQLTATLDCFKWYGRASMGAETECCRVLHE